jgi:hypothetical protein
MPGFLSIVIFATTATAFLAGVHGERWRARLTYLGRRRRRSSKPLLPLHPVSTRPRSAAPDSVEQLRVVMDAVFEKRRILSRSEARVLYAAENALKDQKLGWRVMAQVSLGEVLSSPEARAYGAINSKRVDLLIVSHDGLPIAAIEYQGAGHHQGSAPARDAVKREALRRAGVRYIEVMPDHGPEDLAREIARIAAGQAAKTQAPQQRQPTSDVA